MGKGVAGSAEPLDVGGRAVNQSRRQKHVEAQEVFATLSDERVAEMIRALESDTRRSQSALHALRMEQRRRRRPKEKAAR